MCLPNLNFDIVGSVLYTVPVFPKKSVADGYKIGGVYSCRFYIRGHSLISSVQEKQVLPHDRHLTRFALPELI